VWFYEITGDGNRLVKRAGKFPTQEEALAVGNAYLTINKATMQREDEPRERFYIIAGQEPHDFITVNGEQLDRAAFKAGYVMGWIGCVGSKERDKVRMKEIAEAAADSYLRDNHS
jgi:hypothetical protein